MTEITLAGKTYTLRPLPIRQARVIRAKISDPVRELLTSLKGTDVRLNSVEPGAQTAEVLNALAPAASSLISVLMDATDTIVLETLFAYSPELMADRERIECEATDQEAIAAFLEVVKLLYPFGSLLSSLNGLAK